MFFIYYPLKDSIEIKKGDPFEINRIAESISMADIYQNDVVMIGEAHATGKNYQLMGELLKVMAADNEINYLAFEMPMANATLLNQFIQNNDTEALSDSVDFFSGTVFGSQEFVNLLYLLQDVNNEYHLEISLLGIDGDFSNGNISRIALEEILMDNEIDYSHTPLAEYMNKESMNLKDAQNIKTIFDEEIFSLLSKKDTLTVQEILSQRYSLDKISNIFLLRDKNMFDSFSNFFEALGGKWLINLGGAHVASNSNSGNKSFGSLLYDQDVFDSYSIYLEYINSTTSFSSFGGKAQKLTTIPYNDLIKTEGDRIFSNRNLKSYPYKSFKKYYNETVIKYPDLILILNESEAVKMHDISIYE